MGERLLFLIVTPRPLKNRSNLIGIFFAQPRQNHLANVQPTSTQQKQCAGTSRLCSCEGIKPCPRVNQMMVSVVKFGAARQHDFPSAAAVVVGNSIP